MLAVPEVDATRWNVAPLQAALASITPPVVLRGQLRIKQFVSSFFINLLVFCYSFLITYLFLAPMAEFLLAIYSCFAVEIALKSVQSYEFSRVYILLFTTQ